MALHDDKQIQINTLQVPAPVWSRVKDGEIVVTDMTFYTKSPPYIEKPTLVPVFTKFEAGNLRQRAWRIYTEVTDVGYGKGSLGVGTWADSRLYTATLQWMSIPASNHNFQTGAVTVPEGGCNDRVHFPKPFNSQPQVFCAYNLVDLSNEFRIDLNVHTITSKGFNYEVNSWNAGHVHSAGVTWIAFTGDMPGVDLYTVQPVPQDGKGSSGTITFDKTIDGARVFVGVSKMDLRCDNNARLEVLVSSVTSTSMHWEIKTLGDDGWLNEARVTFLVIGNLYD